MLFALISPISGQDETEVNQNNGEDYQNNGADYQNHGYIGDGDNNYETNGDYNQNNGDDYQNNGADYQNNNNQNNGLDDQNDASNPLDSEELQHLKDMRQEMAGLNRRLKPPSLRNTHSEFKPQSLDLGGDNGEQTFITLGPEKSTTTDTTTTTTEIETTPTTTTDIETTPTITIEPTTITIEPPTPPPGGNETCMDWLPWDECQQSADGSKCEKQRTCVGMANSNETQDCPEFKPPSCKEPPQCNDWGEWGPCKEVNVGPTLSESGCHRERICKDDQNIKMKENCPGGVTAPLCGNEPCERWFPWTECKPSPDGSKCEKTRACDKGRFGGGHLDYNETEVCSGAPPQCEDTPPTPTNQPPTPTPPPEECKEWTEWSPCKHMGGRPGKCRREKICRDGPVFNINSPVEDCPNLEPPKCGNAPPTGNCTEYDYKKCGPTCIRCGCCIDPPGFVGVGEYGCEGCTGGRCEP